MSKEKRINKLLTEMIIHIKHYLLGLLVVLIQVEDVKYIALLFN